MLCNSINWKISPVVNRLIEIIKTNNKFNKKKISLELKK